MSGDTTAPTLPTPLLRMEVDLPNLLSLNHELCSLVHRRLLEFRQKIMSQAPYIVDGANRLKREVCVVKRTDSFFKISLCIFDSL